MRIIAQVNHGAAGVFRVHYDRPMLQALLPAVKSRTLSAMDRFILHSDLLALVSVTFPSETDDHYEHPTRIGESSPVDILNAFFIRSKPATLQ